MIMDTESIELKKTGISLALRCVGLALLVCNIIYYLYNHFN
jgi:hypothetical protein